MSLVIRGVRNKGDIDKERIILYAEADINIGNYIIFDTTYIDEMNISNKLRHSFWFPDLEVEAGDLVVVYTKSGLQKTKFNDDASKTQFLYWALNKTIWNQGEDCAVLIKIEDWITKIV